MRHDENAPLSADRLEAMSLADEKEPVRVCWYGIPGTAKTTHLTSLARRGRMHITDADSGMKARALRDFGIPPENIEPYRDIRYPSLDALFWEMKEELEDDPDAFIGLGLDTVTEAAQRLLGEIVDQKQGAKIAKAEAQHLDASDIDPFFRDRDYYGTLTEQFRRLMRNWKDLGVHLGITAHVRRDVDEETGKVMYGPDVNPAIQNNLMGAVDLIAYCRTDGSWPEGYEVAGQAGYDVMVADMRATNDHHAKDRFHATPRILVNPTFERIIDFITGDLTPDSDEQTKAYRDLFKTRKAEAKQVAEERAARKRERASGRPAKKAADSAPTKTAAKKTASLADEDDDNGEE